MNKSELQAKIAKMEKGLDNPNIQGAAREALQTSLGKAQEQLKKLAASPVAKKKTASKKSAPKDVYVGIDRDSGDGKYDVNIVSMKASDWQADYAANQDNGAWDLIKSKNTLTFVGSYDSLPKAIAGARAYCKANKLNPLNTIGMEMPTEKKTKATPKTAAAPVYSWKKKVNLSQLQAININCQHYHLKIAKATRVSLKRTGKTSMVVNAQPGDHLIFDHDGYPVYLMEAGSFAKKCTTVATPASTAKPKQKPTKKQTTKKKTGKKAKASTKSAAAQPPSAYTKALQSFDQEVDHIRTTYKKPEADQEQVKEDLKALAAKADQKNYAEFVERKLKRLDKDGVRITQQEIVRIGIALRPLIQSVRGTLQDAQNTNRKVLKPTLDNLVRWAKSPGGYDLAGVDAAATKEATVSAKVGEQERVGFLGWVFG